MTDRLAGKIAFITGGASGIGRASALLFAREGARVVVVDLNVEAGEQVVAEVRANGHEAAFQPCDVTNEQAVAEAFTLADHNFGPTDVLYNCAGGSTANDAAVDQLDIGVLETTLRHEVRSAVVCSREALRRMLPNRRGSIINMSSFVAFRGVFNIHAYIAGKGALVSLTRAMAGSYAKEGVRVNAIAPGVALSERARRRIAEPNVAATMTFTWDDYPFAMGEPEDIANVALFLASDESRMITAQTIVADGGLGSY